MKTNDILLIAGMLAIGLFLPKMMQKNITQSVTTDIAEAKTALESIPDVGYASGIQRNSEYLFVWTRGSNRVSADEEKRLNELGYMFVQSSDSKEVINRYMNTSFTSSEAVQAVYGRGAYLNVYTR